MAYFSDPNITLQLTLYLVVFMVSYLHALRWLLWQNPYYAKQSNL